jgi:hypothetical protein
MIDHSVYPDLDDPPDRLETAEQKADYLARVCGAWDFGFPPTIATLALMGDWRDVFDRFPLRHSPSYAAFRSIFGWEPIPGASLLRARYEEIDAREGRQDPCADEV